jgi:thiamine-phosphate pyrophosphorylase
MHINYFKKFLFIDDFNQNILFSIDKDFDIIYRNYKDNSNETLLRKIKNFCKRTNRKFYLSNNLKLALKLDLDGVYIPAFNKRLNFKNLKLKKNFKIIGSAHNIFEIRTKLAQQCELIFLSPIFKSKKNKSFLNIIKFNTLSLNFKNNFIALGGIDRANIKKILLTKSIGIAGISGVNEIKKTAQKINFGPFIN